MRAKKNQYYIDIATHVATRATCNRLRVGCVIVKDDCIISTGYNGAPRGEDHCTDEDHKHGYCEKSVHAEVNAILHSVKNNQNLRGASVYLTHSPCDRCAKILHSYGIKNVYFKEAYRTYDHKKLSLLFNIEQL